MRLIWLPDAWDEYEWWQGQDKKTLKKINSLIRATKRDPFIGEGKPEPLKGGLSGWWSRRIDEKNRLIYKVEGSEDDREIIIMQCRFHYADT